MKRIEIEHCRTLPPKDQLNGILAQYYALIVDRMRGMGFEIPLEAPQSALAEFWENAEDYLPPEGCLLIAKDEAGTIVGCGMMKRLEEDTGELKRVFVTESARGTGTGRALIEAVYAQADQHGAPGVYWLTQDFNTTARQLYDRVAQVTPFIKYARPV